MNYPTFSGKKRDTKALSIKIQRFAVLAALREKKNCRSIIKAR